MAHEVEIKNGVGSMFYVGDRPWHGLGVPLLNPPTIEEGLEAAGLNWTVGLKPLYTAEGVDVSANATVRESDGSILGVVGQSYEPLQNMEAFKFFQPFLDNGLAELQTAGSLREGRRVWVLAKIKADPMVIKGRDTVEKFILLSNSHDGTQAVRVGFVPIRVVCANTLAAAHKDEASKLIRVRHSAQVVANVEALGAIMNVANQTFEANAEQYRMLASKQINAADLKKYIQVVMNIDPDSERESSVMAKIIPMFEKGRGNDMSEIAGTYWAAYNGITEFLQYVKGKDPAIRLDNAWFGTGMTINQRALETAVMMAKVAA